MNQWQRVCRTALATPGLLKYLQQILVESIRIYRYIYIYIFFKLKLLEIIFFKTKTPFIWYLRKGINCQLNYQWAHWQRQDICWHAAPRGCWQPIYLVDSFIHRGINNVATQSKFFGKGLMEQYLLLFLL